MLSFSMVLVLATLELLTIGSRGLAIGEKHTNICLRPSVNTTCPICRDSRNPTSCQYSGEVTNLKLTKSESNCTELELTAHRMPPVSREISSDTRTTITPVIKITIRSDEFVHFCHQQIGISLEEKNCSVQESSGTKATNTTILHDPKTVSPVANASQLSPTTFATPDFDRLPYWIAIGALSLLVLVLCMVAMCLALALHRARVHNKRDTRGQRRKPNTPMAINLPTPPLEPAANISIYNVVYDEVMTVPKVPRNKRSESDLLANRTTGQKQKAERAETRVHCGGYSGTLAVCTNRMNNGTSSSQNPSTTTAATAAIYHTLEDCSKGRAMSSSPKPCTPIYHILELGSAHADSDEDINTCM